MKIDKRLIELWYNENMDKKVLELNSLYDSLINCAKKCQQLFEAENKTTKFVWANNHYEKFDDEYVCEVYPIPVIEIEGVGDVGFNLNKCFYEGYFSKERLLDFNFDLLKDIGEYAIYGESDCLVDIYNSRMKDVDVKKRIRNSVETNIAINFTFKFEEIEKIIDLIIKLVSKGEKRL